MIALFLSDPESSDLLTRTLFHRKKDAVQWLNRTSNPIIKRARLDHGDFRVGRFQHVWRQGWTSYAISDLLSVDMVMMTPQRFA